MRKKYVMGLIISLLLIFSITSIVIAEDVFYRSTFNRNVWAEYTVTAKGYEAYRSVFPFPLWLSTIASLNDGDIIRYQTIDLNAPSSVFNKLSLQNVNMSIALNSQVLGYWQFEYIGRDGITCIVSPFDTLLCVVMPIDPAFWDQCSNAGQEDCRTINVVLTTTEIIYYSSLRHSDGITNIECHWQKTYGVLKTFFFQLTSYSGSQLASFNMVLNDYGVI